MAFTGLGGRVIHPLKMHHCNAFLMDICRKSSCLSEIFIFVRWGNYDDVVVVQMEDLPPAVAQPVENFWRNRMSSARERPETKKGDEKPKFNNNNNSNNSSNSNSNNSEEDDTADVIIKLDITNHI